MMEESRRGVDWHEDGGDVSPYLLVCLLLAFAVPVALVAVLLLVVL